MSRIYDQEDTRVFLIGLEAVMFVSIGYWFAFALILAGLEVEAEGKYGWAERMPTWYRTSGLAGRLYGMLMGGKPLTGYHAWMFVMPATALHAGFFTGAPWSFSAELVVLARFFAIAVLWDFLWFVINPHYGVKRFTKDRVWWHRNWIFGMPVDYPMGWLISAGLAFGAQTLGNAGALVEHVQILGGLFVLTIVTILASPLYHRWYRSMRHRDDRDQAGIFHKD